MRLDLHELINVPGKSISFCFEEDLSDLDFTSVAAFKAPASVSGIVCNDAGVVHMEAKMAVDMLCICDRCAIEFDMHRNVPVEAIFAEEITDEVNSEVYLLSGNFADISEVIRTAFVLNMSSKILCRDDCLGICEKCGKRLNDGPCDCRPEADQRLAVLKQLL